jgi:hypothetical protein
MIRTLAYTALVAEEPIEPVRLVHEGAGSETGLPAADGWMGTGVSIWLWVVVSLAVVLLAWVLIRRFPIDGRADVQAVTFRRLSRRLRLSRSEREFVVSLAASSPRGEDPVALLLSQDAVIRCAAAAGVGRGGALPRDLPELHAKIFSVDPA